MIDQEEVMVAEARQVLEVVGGQHDDGAAIAFRLERPRQPSSRVGIQDLRYIGNTFVAEWKGCPPEALAKLGVHYE